MKRIVTCLAFLLFTAYGYPSFDSTLWENVPTDCGRRRPEFDMSADEKDRIINGTRAKLGQYPWMVRLGKRLRDGRIHFNCGGSLITRKFVLSAAHCNEFNHLVRLGQTFRTEKQCDKSICAPPYQDIDIKRYIFEDYCPTLRINDAMLIEMQEPATLNDFVRTVCLPPASLSIRSLIGKTIDVAGFGLTNGNKMNSISPDLLYISNTILEPETCKPLYKDLDERQQFCISGSGGKLACNGDSGGGNIVFANITNETRGYVIGINSYLKIGCIPEKNSIHVLVEYFLERILTHIKNN